MVKFTIDTEKFDSEVVNYSPKSVLWKILGLFGIKKTIKLKTVQSRNVSINKLRGSDGRNKNKRF